MTSTMPKNKTQMKLKKLQTLYFQNIPTGSGYWGFLPGGKRPGAKVTIHLHLVSKLKMSGVIPLLPLYAFMGWTGKNYTFVLCTMMGQLLLAC
jgi:hypothetical protein